tara:strand:+ start:109 stop:303 length:195 start_codon:yes stop_codon:yes gene_type:complete
MLGVLILEVGIEVGLLGELVAVGFGLASVVGVGSTCGAFVGTGVGSGVFIGACCATVPVPIFDP